MPRRLTGIRTARSLITTAVGASFVGTDEIDFELASNQGLEIDAIKHIFTELNLDVVTTLARANFFATLHAETLTLEDPTPDVNHTVRDSEVLDMSAATYYTGDDSGAAQGGMASSAFLGSVGWEKLPDDFIIVSNLTHRFEADAVSDDGTSIYLIRYRYVELSLSELGLFLALRR